MHNNIIILPMDNFNFPSLQISTLLTSGFQPMAFINLFKKRCAIKTEPIRITSHGIPRLDDNHFEAADIFFGSDDMRAKLLGAHQDKFSYTQIIKKKVTPSEGDGNAADLPQKLVKTYPDHVKVKFDMRAESSHDDKKNYTIVKVNDKKLKLNTITEINHYVKFACLAKYTIVYSKIWANKCSQFGLKKWYGVGLKVSEIELVKYEYVSSSKAICDVATIKNTYKKYMQEKRESIQQNLIQNSLVIEV